jgi:hypothetical protein
MSASYETVSAKLGKVEAATKSISREVFDAAKKAGHEIWYMWGYDGNAGNPEHHSGRALDFMVHNHAAGQWVRNYIWTNRKRLRLQHVIWEQHITSTVTSPGVVRKMADRGSPTENHMDHVHALFFAGSYQKPSPSSPAPSNPTKLTVAEVAKEIVEKGNWGNGPERVRKLLAAHLDPAKVQAEVERLLQSDHVATGPKGRKTYKQLADEVYRGLWGDDPQRSKKLQAAGYDPATVQREVNHLVNERRR